MSSNDALSSCRLQYGLCRSFVESLSSIGWTLIDERFDDDGVSGATLERRALRRLMERVRHREVIRS